MVIRALDHVKRCYSTADGIEIARVLRSALKQERHVTFSFAGVDDVPSSFVNAAFVSLLDDYAPTALRSRLSVVDATQQIADMLRRCMANGAKMLEAA